MTSDGISTRERIAKAAGELWEELGRRPTIDQVARHAGVSRATVYRYFPNQSALSQAAGAGTGEQDWRGQILEASLELFEHKGFQATSMDEVAEAAGTAKGTIYRHFSSKADLFRGVVEHIGLLRHVQRIARRAGREPGLKGLEEFITLVLELGRQRSGFLRALFCEVQRVPPLRRLFVQTAVRPGLQAIQRIIEREQAEGRIREIPARQAAIAWVSLLGGFNLLRATLRDELQLEDEGLGSVFFTILTQGLSTDGPATEGRTTQASGSRRPGRKEARR